MNQCAASSVPTLFRQSMSQPYPLYTGKVHLRRTFEIDSISVPPGAFSNYRSNQNLRCGLSRDVSLDFAYYAAASQNSMCLTDIVLQSNAFPSSKRALPEDVYQRTYCIRLRKADGVDLSRRTSIFTVFTALGIALRRNSSVEKVRPSLPQADLPADTSRRLVILVRQPFVRKTRGKTLIQLVPRKGVFVPHKGVLVRHKGVLASRRNPALRKWSKILREFCTTIIQNVLHLRVEQYPEGVQPSREM